MYKRENPGLIAVPDWQSAALPFAIKDVIAVASIDSATATQRIEAQAISRLRLPVPKTTLAALDAAIVAPFHRGVAILLLLDSHFAVPDH